MMEVVKEMMIFTHRKAEGNTQIIMDDDHNVPDANADIARIMKQTSEVQVDMVRILPDKVSVKGKLIYRILYSSEDRGSHSIHNLKGEVPFDELINMEGVQEGDEISIEPDIEDNSITLIHSRKISVRAVVTLHACAEETLTKEPGSALSGEPDLEYTTQKLTFTPAAVKTRDVYRIKDDMELSANKPNIARILWTEAQIRMMDTRPLEGSLYLQGEIAVFVLYQSEDENASYQWVELTIPVQGNVECRDAAEDMIPDIHYRLNGNEIEAKPDNDGEQRVIGLDYVIDMDITLYRDASCEIMNDVYSSMRNLEPVQETIFYEHLLARNSSKCKASEKIKLSGQQPRILQIISSNGTIKIDEVVRTENGLQIDGIVTVSVLYLTADDNQPIQQTSGMIPFSYQIEIPGMHEYTSWRLRHSLEQLGAVMLGGEEAELKAMIHLEVLVMEQLHTEIITNVEAKPYDMEEIEKLPGIVGYIVKKEDSLWKIAKKYYTTIESIREINELTEDRVKAGDRLVLIKKVEEI
ncbi:MAG: DUF3794 domain-containing protein [Lachnospiraceae bacterium]|nr:DUF3794 domain-containing protein [Lachnospiraceae bacterium]